MHLFVIRSLRGLMLFIYCQFLYAPVSFFVRCFASRESLFLVLQRCESTSWIMFYIFFALTNVLNEIIVVTKLNSWPSLLFTNLKWFLALCCKRSILSFPIIYSLGFGTAGFGGKFGAESAGTCRIIHFMLHISFSSFFPPFPIFCFIFYPCGRGLVAGLDKIIGISAGYFSLLGKPIHSKVSASVQITLSYLMSLFPI